MSYHPLSKIRPGTAVNYTIVLYYTVIVLYITSSIIPEDNKCTRVGFIAQYHSPYNMGYATHQLPQVIHWKTGEK